MGITQEHIKKEEEISDSITNALFEVRREISTINESHPKYQEYKQREDALWNQRLQQQRIIQEMECYVSGNWTSFNEQYRPQKSGSGAWVFILIAAILTYLYYF